MRYIFLLLLLFLSIACEQGGGPKKEEGGGEPQKQGGCNFAEFPWLADKNLEDIDKLARLVKETQCMEQEWKRFGSFGIRKPENNIGFPGYIFTTQSDRIKGIKDAERIISDSKARLFVKMVLIKDPDLEKSFPQFKDYKPKEIIDNLESMFEPDFIQNLKNIPDKDLTGFSLIGVPKFVENEIMLPDSGKPKSTKIYLMEYVHMEGDYDEKAPHWKKNDPKNNISNEQWLQLWAFVTFHYNEQFYTGAGPNFLLGRDKKVFVVDTEEANFKNIPKG